ncbi:M81 family metallopeptidase [Humitalea sp. 24SJ18S-53]|uniref:M81 family metallopeptidase n=1 Tax=Humitalea sp. 24SJ18S-53 TaxID=3422307 RepID=UPI003D6713E7
MSMRVALLQLNHEANGFSPLPIAVRDFKARHWCEGEEVRRRFGATRNWLGGAIAGCDAAGADLAIGLCMSSHPGGAVLADAFAEMRAALLASLRAICAEGQPDVVLLLLHGALVVEGCAMPEGDVAADVRAIVGPDCIIGSTLDFHANIDPLLVDSVDLLIGGQLYPHTDTFDRGRRLAELAIASRVARRKTRRVLLPIASGLPRQETNTPGSAVGDLVVLGNALAAQYGLDDLTLMGGFHFADNDWTGMSILATGGAPAAQDAAILALADAVWDRRAALLEPVPDLAAVTGPILSGMGRGMLLVVDTGDNPGGGGTGETASLLPWLVGQGLDYAAGFFVDGALAREAARAGLGGQFDATVGGSFTAPATVEWLGDITYRNIGPMMTGELLEGGPGAVLRIGNGRIIVTTERIQAYDIQAFLGLGIDLAARQVVLVKSSAHFRASYTGLAAGGILLCDGGGCSSSDLTRFPFVGRMRDILPLRPLDKAAWDARIRADGSGPSPPAPAARPRHGAA